MTKYELQILDSYQNKTYYDGQCGAIYKQRPPIVNASRGPGQWQTYDIIFEAPKFADDGSLIKPAFITVLHNGVLIQNHFQLLGSTFYDRAPVYEKHEEKLPILIQFHGNPIRFRNIWVRENIQPLAGTPTGGAVGQVQDSAPIAALPQEPAPAAISVQEGVPCPCGVEFGVVQPASGECLWVEPSCGCWRDRILGRGRRFR
jgi:hypothetical protein